MTGHLRTPHRWDCQRSLPWGTVAVSPGIQVLMNRQERFDAEVAGNGDSKPSLGEPANAASSFIAGALMNGEAMQLVGFSRSPVGNRIASASRNLVASAKLQISVGSRVKFAAANAVNDAVSGS